MIKKKFFKTKNEAEVTFEYPGEDLSSVSLVADFTQWQPVNMRYVKKDKVFRAKVRLPKNETFLFRYLLDGSHWENDHKADEYLPNPYGSDNSVVYTTAA